LAIANPQTKTLRDRAEAGGGSRERMGERTRAAPEPYVTGTTEETTSRGTRQSGKGDCRPSEIRAVKESPQERKGRGKRGPAFKRKGKSVSSNRQKSHFLAYCRDRPKKREGDIKKTTREGRLSVKGPLCHQRGKERYPHARGHKRGLRLAGEKKEDLKRKEALRP